MKRSRFTDTQIISILKEADADAITRIGVYLHDRMPHFCIET